MKYLALFAAQLQRITRVPSETTERIERWVDHVNTSVKETDEPEAVSMSAAPVWHATGNTTNAPEGIYPDSYHSSVYYVAADGKIFARDMHPTDQL